MYAVKNHERHLIRPPYPIILTNANEYIMSSLFASYEFALSLDRKRAFHGCRRNSITDLIIAARIVHEDAEYFTGFYIYLNDKPNNNTKRIQDINYFCDWFVNFVDEEQEEHPRHDTPPLTKYHLKLRPKYIEVRGTLDLESDFHTAECSSNFQKCENILNNQTQNYDQVKNAKSLFSFDLHKDQLSQTFLHNANKDNIHSHQIKPPPFIIGGTSKPLIFCVRTSKDWQFDEVDVSEDSSDFDLCQKKCYLVVWCLELS
ncbi:hypothetical protein RF11_02038 [Thelohanellus kitauei]|uniref:Uncharacterized protein n=1 Tax=Thelohanellus kitauei TaxID=669202 RepID=A0A0C2MV63_THEKT|nr:hypothetical protein RF11_02038 [Thelohanellus kitauei]